MKKDFEYYKQKTKIDDARRASEVKKNNSGEVVAGIAYFLSVRLRFIVTGILRTVIILALVANLVIGGIVFSKYHNDNDITLFIFFVIINVILIMVSTMIFWRRGLYVVLIGGLVVSIFAYCAPFYHVPGCVTSDEKGEIDTSLIENTICDFNYYGVRL